MNKLFEKSLVIQTYKSLLEIVGRIITFYFIGIYMISLNYNLYASILIFIAFALWVLAPAIELFSMILSTIALKIKMDRYLKELD